MRPINDIFDEGFIDECPTTTSLSTIFLPILPFKVPYSNNDFHSLPLLLKAPLHVFSLVVLLRLNKKKKLVIFLVVMMCKEMKMKVIFCWCDSQRNKGAHNFIFYFYNARRSKEDLKSFFFWCYMWKNAQKLADFSCFVAMVCKKVKSEKSFSFFCCCDIWMKSSSFSLCKSCTD